MRLFIVVVVVLLLGLSIGVTRRSVVRVNTTVSDSLKVTVAVSDGTLVNSRMK